MRKGPPQGFPCGSGLCWVGCPWVWLGSGGRVPYCQPHRSTGLGGEALTLTLPVALPLTHTPRPCRERMEAMEKQIASLTGLVQSALLRGSEAETPR